jgi:hypothetical protein
MMKTPADKTTSYFVLSLVSLVAVYFVLGLILTTVLIGGAFRM